MYHLSYYKTFIPGNGRVETVACRGELTKAEFDEKKKDLVLVLTSIETIMV